MIDDPDYDIGSVGCSLPDVGVIARFALLSMGGVVLVGALGLWLINKLRLW